MQGEYKFYIDGLEPPLSYSSPLPLFRPSFFVVFPAYFTVMHKVAELEENSWIQRFHRLLVSETDRCWGLLATDFGSPEALKNFYVNDPYKRFMLLFNSFISSISVTRSRTGESTAHISLELPRYAWPFYDAVLHILDQIFVPMWPLRIYMGGRFKNRLYPVFTGFITTVAYADKGGYLSISLDCTDMTKLLMINPANVNPAIVERRTFGLLLEKGEFMKPNVWSNPFTQMSLEEIVRVLIVGSEAVDMPGVGRIAIDGIGNITVVWRDPLEVEKAQLLQDANAFQKTVDIRQISITPYSLMKPALFFLVFRQMTPYKFMDTASIPVFQSDVVSRWDVIRDLTGLTFTEFFADECGNYVMLPMRLNNIYLRYDWLDGSGNPYRFGSREDVVDGVYVVCDDELINMDLNFNDREVVTALDIYGEYPLSQSANEFYEWVMRGFAQDYELMRRFGLRWQRIKMPLINNFSFLFERTEGEKTESLKFKKEEADKLGKRLDAFADIYLRYLNSRAYSGSVSLVLRPELVPAKPIYIADRDEVFYIDTVTHSITVGGSASTELSLVYGRKSAERIDFLDSLLSLHDPRKLKEAMIEKAVDQGGAQKQ